ncbi:MAG TPA: glyoxalase [Thiotrichales bacterium]|nr:glyoxalase [Thiotrichales bacterium]
MTQPNDPSPAFHHCSLIVASTEKALTFYRDLLGLAVNAERPDLGYPGAWLEIGGGQIHLLELPNPDVVDGRPAHGGRDRHLALSIADLDSVQVLLEQAGLSYTLSRSGRRALFCRDFDGNAIELIEKNDAE